MFTREMSDKTSKICFGSAFTRNVGRLYLVQNAQHVVASEKDIIQARKQSTTIILKTMNTENLFDSGGIIDIM